MALLAHLYPHIRGSQEDIATLSLHYLLMQSPDLNAAFTRKIRNLAKIELEDTLQYACQVVGNSDEKERPDMVGVDSRGNETPLYEMKFFASLTNNQPLTYIDRLNKNNGKCLVFICPSSRCTSLWSKLYDLCKERHIEQVDSSCILVDNVALSICTWSEIIDSLEQVASTTAIAYSSDLKQLKDYCAYIEDEAFIPFSADDLSAEMANKCERYYQVVDEVIEMLCADKTITTSKERLKANAYRNGYTRSLYIDDYTITFNYDRTLWKNPSTVETPFWVSVRDKDWNQNAKISEKLSKVSDNKKTSLWGMTFLALEPLQSSTLEEVSADIKKKVIGYLDMVKANW